MKTFKEFISKTKIFRKLLTFSEMFESYDMTDQHLFWLLPTGHRIYVKFGMTHFDFFESNMLRNINNTKIKKELEEAMKIDKESGEYERLYYWACKYGYISIIVGDYTLNLRLINKRDITDKHTKEIFDMIKKYSVDEVNIDWMKLKNNDIEIYSENYSTKEFYEEIL